MIKRITALLLLAVLSIAQSGCGGIAGSSEPVSRDEYCLDTICTVSIYRMKDESGEVKDASKLKSEAESAIDAAFVLCGELEDKLSRTRTESDISRINSAKGEWTDVSEETRELIQKGMEYSHVSDGGFDITIGGVTGLWDFHAADGEAKLPDEKRLAEAVKHVNYRNIAIEGNRIRLSDPETEIDLGGIAKGYIADRMTEVLEEKGAVSATVNLGGNVVCIGGKTDSDDFVIGVETPFSDRTEIIGKISGHDKTFVTSGVYERMIKVDGRTYHHVLDTKTGWPVKTDLDAVTLIADKGRSADIDAMSTICLIKGAEAGKEFIEKTDGVEGVFVRSDGSIETTAGAGFEKEK